MKTTTSLVKTSADEDLLSNAHFDPVFDAEGNLVDIVHLQVTTDRSRGIKAMLEMANSTEKGDEAIFQDGWTQKQRRIVNSPAPGAAHTIKRSKRWDAAQGAFVPTATLILPFEVVWVLFEEVFGGNYSVEIKEIIHESEDVVGSGVEGARDLTGRIFYARACVSLTVHLANGSKRIYEGVGVAYDTVRMEMTGNVFAINSARRTAEKGAISDAKREALANAGRVFRRAFEDGDKALQAIEDKLMEKMRIQNSNRPATPTKPNVAAPRKPQKENTENSTSKQDVIPGDYVPMDAMEDEKKSSKEKKEASESEQVTSEKEKTDVKSIDDSKKEENNVKSSKKETEVTKVKATSENHFSLEIEKDNKVNYEHPTEIYDAAIAHLDTLETQETQINFLEKNKVELQRAEMEDDIGELKYADLLDMISDEIDDHSKNIEEDKSEDEKDNSQIVLSPDKMTGEAILKSYETAFEMAKTPKEVQSILDANTDLAKRLTKRQKLTLSQMCLKAQK
jgi:hypothetical protein